MQHVCMVCNMFSKRCTVSFRRHKSCKPAEVELFKAFNGLVRFRRCGCSSCSGLAWPVVMWPDVISFFKWSPKSLMEPLGTTVTPLCSPDNIKLNFRPLCLSRLSADHLSLSSCCIRTSQIRKRLSADGNASLCVEQV